MNTGKLFIVCAISGAGKTTLIHEVLRRLSENNYAVQPLITYTTRAPRENEVRGVDYHFISHEEFIEKQKNNFFFEMSTFNSHLYGMSNDFLPALELGTSFIVALNHGGTKEMVHRLSEYTIPILITPPSLEVARERMIKRGGMSQAQIEKRMELARKEIEEEEKNHRLFTYHIVNDVFDQAAQEFYQLVRGEVTQAS